MSSFGYNRIVDLFDKDETAGSFLREDGEGGFSSGVWRMAREIDRLRGLLNANGIDPGSEFICKCGLRQDAPRGDPQF